DQCRACAARALAPAVPNNVHEFVSFGPLAASSGNSARPCKKMSNGCDCALIVGAKMLIAADTCLCGIRNSGRSVAGGSGRAVGKRWRGAFWKGQGAPGCVSFTRQRSNANDCAPRFALPDVDACGT